MIKYHTRILLFLLFSANSLFAQLNVFHISEIKSPLLMDKSKPLRELSGIIAQQKNDFKDGIIPIQKYLPPQNKSKVSLINRIDPVLQGYNGFKAPGDILLNIDGIDNRNLMHDPPDISGDIGPNHYLEMVNTNFQIWDKNGNSLYGPFKLNTIWQGLMNNINDGDPVVLYDDLADRWFVSQFGLPNYPNGPFYELVAVSATPDPLGQWYRYLYKFDNMNDYPKFGVWPDGYYMSANIFTSGAMTFKGAVTAVWDRNKMLTGDSSASVQMFYFANPSSSPYCFLPSDCDGAAPPLGSPNYFVWAKDSAEFGGTDQLQIYEFHVNWINPDSSTLTGPFIMQPASFTKMPGHITQMGTSRKLDDLSGRLMHRLQYRNFGDHEALVACQTVNANAGQAGIRWYELTKTTGKKWNIFQQGTYAPNDAIHRWLGSIAMDSSENIALGYSVAGYNNYPSIRFTGRLSTDSLNKMTFVEKSIVEGGGFKSDVNERWGDYSTMSVSPDGSTFWYANEYIKTSGAMSWFTRIASFQLSELVSVKADNPPQFIPQYYTLGQNFPNPFNPSTTIRYSLPLASNVKITLINTLGESVKELTNKVQSPGTYNLDFVASGLASGIYFYTMQANSLNGKQSFMHTGKMILLK
jgi:hypothetical protein